MFMGSCFTENIGNLMQDLNYPVDINPFGILYNPVSVQKGLRRLMHAKSYGEDELVHHGELWHSFDHHGRFSGMEKQKVLKGMNDRLLFSSDFLRKSDFLFLTFGTAWVYKYIANDTLVSNCHKIPAAQFVRERLSAASIVDSYQTLLADLWGMNPGLRIIFTVSPVRHWKDGAVENQRSKSILILAVDELCRMFPEQCAYFPSYEIVMDELRDYRFYGEDMLHLTNTAVEYIWERFENSLIDPESQSLSKKIKKIKLALAHRPFNKYTPGHLKFLKGQLSKAEELSRVNPIVNLEIEKKSFHARILDIESQMS